MFLDSSSLRSFPGTLSYKLFYRRGVCAARLGRWKEASIALLCARERLRETAVTDTKQLGQKKLVLLEGLRSGTDGMRRF